MHKDIIYIFFFSICGNSSALLIIIVIKMNSIMVTFVWKNLITLLFLESSMHAVRICLPSHCMAAIAEWDLGNINRNGMHKWQ